MIFSRNKEERCRGAATVEAVVAFTGFLFTIFTILNIVNFCRAQALISNAVDTTAKELSQYGYFYNISGLQKFSEDFSANAQVGSDKIDGVIGSVDDLYKSLGSAVDKTAQRATDITNALEDGSVSTDTFKQALSDVESDASNIEANINLVSANIGNIITNPISYLKSLAAIAGNETLNLAKSRLIAVPLAKAFFTKHFGETVEEADAELKALGVVDGLEGMNFNMSTMFNSEAPEDVHIVVFYKLQIIQLFKFADMNAVIRKDAVAQAWLGGDDVIVKVTASEEPASDEPSGDDTKEEDASKTDDESTTEETTTEETTTEEIEYNYWSTNFDSLFESQYGIDLSSNPDVGEYRFSKTDQRSAYLYTNALYSNDGVVEEVAACRMKVLNELKAKFDSDPSAAAEYKNMQFCEVVYVPKNMPQEEQDKIELQQRTKIREIKASGQYDSVFDNIDFYVKIEEVEDGNYNYGG